MKLPGDIGRGKRLLPLQPHAPAHQRYGQSTVAKDLVMEPPPGEGVPGSLTVVLSERKQIPAGPF